MVKKYMLAYKDLLPNISLVGGQLQGEYIESASRKRYIH